jgi:hypothetical protein
MRWSQSDGTFGYASLRSAKVAWESRNEGPDRSSFAHQGEALANDVRRLAADDRQREFIALTVPCGGVEEAQSPLGQLRSARSLMVPVC